MVRPNRIKVICRRLAKKKKLFNITNVVRYVLSVARCGLSQSQAEEFCLSNDIVPPTKAQFFKCQLELIPIIEKLARECCEEAKNGMKAPYILTYDGSWSSRRNATHCIVEFINEDNKIVDFDYMSRLNLQEKKKGMEGYSGPSNKMEEILVQKISARWKDDTNLRAIVHDGDIKTWKYWKSDPNDFPGVAELHDPGHMKKTLAKVFDEYNYKRQLYGLKKHVIKYFAVVCKLQNITMAEKIEKWMSLKKFLKQKNPNKYYWNPKKRRARKNSPKSCHKAMMKFITNTVKYVKFCSVADTQKNESFHSLKAKIAPKYINWRSSWRLRMSLAIIRWNLGEKHREWVDQKLGITYSKTCSDILRKIDCRLQKKRISTKSEDARHDRNKKRDLKRKSNKLAKDGHQYANSSNKVKKITKQEFQLLPGICNLGQTCYVSSSIQLLHNSSIPDVFKILRCFEPTNEIVKKFNLIFKDLSEEKNIIGDAIKDLLKETPPFAIDIPADPAEYLNFVLNLIQSKKWIFGFQRNKKIHCLLCNYHNSVYENDFFLKIPFKEISNVRQIDLKKKEIIRYNCPMCNEEKDIEIIENIFALARFLFIQPIYQSTNDISNMTFQYRRSIDVINYETFEPEVRTYNLVSLIRYKRCGKSGHY